MPAYLYPHIITTGRESGSENFFFCFFSLCSKRHEKPNAFIYSSMRSRYSIHQFGSKQNRDIVRQKNGQQIAPAESRCDG